MKRFWYLFQRRITTIQEKGQENYKTEREKREDEREKVTEPEKERMTKIKRGRENKEGRS